MRYRADIDGLRAVAVLGVVAFHLDARLLPGGYVGVDVFFVISGYLITGLILGRSAAGTFAYADFYRRRALRLMPLLAVVTLSTLLAGSVLMTPSDMAELVRAGLAGMLSAGNLYDAFALDASYFAPSAEAQPLLHLWSLGVEEQFYLLWPALLIATARAGGRRTALVIGGLAASSVALSIVLTPLAPMSAYYLLPTRAFQLLGGAALALAAREGAVLGPRAGGAAGVIGLSLVCACLVLLADDQPYPGWRALLPTLGAMLILAGGERTGAGGAARLLSSRPLVAIGLASYALYLWHWPVLALWRYVDPVLGPAELAAASGLFTLLTVVTHLSIERPARAARTGLRVAVGTYVVAPTVLLLVLAIPPMFAPSDERTAKLSFKPAEGDPWRTRGVATPTLARALPWVCQHPVLTDALITSPDCVIGPPGRRPAVLVWGDSHAAHLVPYLAYVARATDTPFRAVAHSACPPLRDRPERFATARHARNCQASGAALAPHVEGYDALVLSAAWTAYLRRDGFAAALRAELEAHGTAGRDVLLLGAAPRFAEADPKCLSEPGWSGTERCTERYRAPLGRAVLAANAELSAMADGMDHVAFADPLGVLCEPSGDCDATRDGVPLYWDGGHLNWWGADRLGREAAAGDLSPFLAAFTSVRPNGTAPR